MSESYLITEYNYLIFHYTHVITSEKFRLK